VILITQLHHLPGKGWTSSPKAMPIDIEPPQIPDELEGFSSPVPSIPIDSRAGLPTALPRATYWNGNGFTYRYRFRLRPHRNAGTLSEKEDHEIDDVSDILTGWKEFLPYCTRNSQYL
jgi:hypothetical protein